MLYSDVRNVNCFSHIVQNCVLTDFFFRMLNQIAPLGNLRHVKRVRKMRLEEVLYCYSQTRVCFFVVMWYSNASVILIYLLTFIVAQ